MKRFALILALLVGCRPVHHEPPATTQSVAVAAPMSIDEAMKLIDSRDTWADHPAINIPRHPAEAPLEYVERALLSLDTSAGAVRRLTDLFEWARFSHHDPEPSMRDDAVDALVAVRDELRTSELELTPA